MPKIPLIDYSILLEGNRYCIIIQGINIFEGKENYYCFSKILLKPGEKYSVKTIGKEVIFF